MRLKNRRETDTRHAPALRLRGKKIHVSESYIRKLNYRDGTWILRDSNRAKCVELCILCRNSFLLLSCSWLYFHSSFLLFILLSLSSSGMFYFSPSIAITELRRNLHKFRSTETKREREKEASPNAHVRRTLFSATIVRARQTMSYRGDTHVF